jgi:hypothetical protein
VKIKLHEGERTSAIYTIIPNKSHGKSHYHLAASNTSVAAQLDTIIDRHHRLSPLGELYNTNCSEITRHEVVPGTKLWDCADADTRTLISSEWTRGNM